MVLAASAYLARRTDDPNDGVTHCVAFVLLTISDACFWRRSVFGDPLVRSNKLSRAVCVGAHQAKIPRVQRQRGQEILNGQLPLQEFR